MTRSWEVACAAAEAIGMTAAAGQGDGSGHSRRSWWPVSGGPPHQVPTIRAGDDGR